MCSKTKKTDSLRCPVCTSLSEDQCFVCPSHHTLCRTCYQSIVRMSASGGDLCPLCRAKMTRPIENTDRRNLIRRIKQEKASQKAVDSKELENQCKLLVQEAETAANEDELEEAVVKKELDGAISRCCEELRSCQAEINESLSLTSFTARLRADEAALGVALDAENLRQASVAHDRLLVTLSEIKSLERLVKRITCSIQLNFDAELPKTVKDIDMLRFQINDEMQFCHLLSSSLQSEQSLVTQKWNSIDLRMDRILATVRMSRNCQAMENDESCGRRPFKHCDHCDRDLCQVHFSKDRLDFENECRKLLAEACETRSASTLEKLSVQFLQKWNVKIMRSLEELEKRLCQMRQSLASTAPARMLQAEAAALNGEAARTGGVKNVKKIAAKLSAALLERDETRLEISKLAKSAEACLLSRDDSLSATVAKIELLWKLKPLELRRSLLASVRSIQAKKVASTRL